MATAGDDVEVDEVAAEGVVGVVRVGVEITGVLDDGPAEEQAAKRAAMLPTMTKRRNFFNLASSSILNY